MIDLPVMEHTFEINKKGKNAQKVYTGSFTYKRLSIGDQSKAGILKTKLNGDLINVDQDVNHLHDMLSWLRYGLIEYPEWWRDCNFGNDLFDVDIIEDIYRQVFKFETEWVKKINENSNSSTETSSKEDK